MELRGIDVIMQKLICGSDSAGRGDAARQRLHRARLPRARGEAAAAGADDDGAPLPSSYPAQLSAAGVDDGEDEGRTSSTARRATTSSTSSRSATVLDVDEDAASRLVDLGFAAHEAHHALRLARNNPHRARAAARRAAARRRRARRGDAPAPRRAARDARLPRAAAGGARRPADHARAQHRGDALRGPEVGARQRPHRLDQRRRRRRLGARPRGRRGRLLGGVRPSSAARRRCTSAPSSWCTSCATRCAR